MRDERLFLDDILLAAREIADFMSAITLADFASDKKLQYAILNRLTAIGEAVKNLSADTKTRMPEIDRKGFAGIRDLIAHQYFSLELELVWVTANDDVPALAVQVRKFLEK